MARLRIRPTDSLVFIHLATVPLTTCHTKHPVTVWFDLESLSCRGEEQPCIGLLKVDILKQQLLS
jgi:hypothetical protein